MLDVKELTAAAAAAAVATTTTVIQFVKCSN